MLIFQRRAQPVVVSSCYLLLNTPTIHPSMTERPRPYIVKSLVHASKILKAFQHPGEVLRLRISWNARGSARACVSAFAAHAASLRIRREDRRELYRLIADIDLAGDSGSVRVVRAGQFVSREVHAGLVRAAEREHLS